MERILGALILFLAIMCTSSESGIMHKLDHKGHPPKPEDEATSLEAPPPEAEKGSSVFKVDIKEAVAEAIGMMMLIGMGCGATITIMGEEGSAWVLQIALTFGFSIAALSYAIDFFCHGHLNPAVTFGMMLVGYCNPLQCVLNIVFQLLGSFMGACMLHGLYPPEIDRTKVLASNIVEEGYSWQNVLVGEAAFTCMYVFVFLQQGAHPAADASSGALAVALGLAAFLAHSVLIPIDGCCINPARFFGPAWVSAHMRDNDMAFKDWWLFWLGPFLGAAIAAFSFWALGDIRAPVDLLANGTR